MKNRLVSMVRPVLLGWVLGMIVTPVHADHSSECGGDCRQVMLSMSYAANLFGDIKLEEPNQNRLARLTEVTAERVDCALTTASTLNGGWDRTWGPAMVFAPQGLITPSGTTMIINTFNPTPVANAMFVAKKRDAEVYVVAIAGTDAKSTFDWKKEDLDAYPVVWPYGTHWDTVRVTRGTLTGLHMLQSLTSTSAVGPDKGDEQSLQDYLQQVVANEEATIFVTGHSLGGALSPATALWLHDQRHDWDPEAKATLKIVAFAGATPGDRAFAGYVGKRFEGDQLAIVNNSLDVVPHAFGLSTLQELATLYQGAQIEPTAREKGALLTAIANVQKANQYGIHFETLGTGTQVQGFDGDLLSKADLLSVTDCFLYESATASLDPYAREALYQHVCAYPVKLGVPELNPQMHQCQLEFPRD